MKPRVVIIGGGVAGLTAATTLIKNGKFDVTLLEADGRIGGRVQTLKLGDYFIENGAQWVHGNERNSVFHKAQPLDLLDTSGNNLKFNSNAIFITQSGYILPKKKYKTFQKVLGKITNGPTAVNSTPEQPLGQWSEKLFWDDDTVKEFNDEDKLLATQILDWQHRFQTGIDGSDNWHFTSCRGQQEYWECPGNPLNAWKPPASYASLLNLILHDKPSLAPQFIPEIPEWIHLGKEVTKVNYSEKEVKLECGDGEIYTADHVICTVSLGVLKEKAASLFFPSLPDSKLKAIKYLGIGCVDKLHFDFEHKWWPDEIIGFNLLWNTQEPARHYSSDASDEELKTKIDGLPLWCRGILGFYVVASHPTALNSWITGPSARIVETLDENIVKSTFMKVLHKFVGPFFNIPELKNFVRSTWFSNPYIRGSYSFRSVESEEHNVWATDIAAPILKEETPILCFGGEASHIHFHSTVHGAHDSGVREATRLINFIEGSTTEVSPFLPYTEDMFKEEI